VASDSRLAGEANDSGKMAARMATEAALKWPAAASHMHQNGKTVPVCGRWQGASQNTRMRSAMMEKKEEKKLARC